IRIWHRIPELAAWPCDERMRVLARVRDRRFRNAAGWRNAANPVDQLVYLHAAFEKPKVAVWPCRDLHRRLAYSWQREFRDGPLRRDAANAHTCYVHEPHVAIRPSGHAIGGPIKWQRELGKHTRWANTPNLAAAGIGKPQVAISSSDNLMRLAIWGRAGVVRGHMELADDAIQRDAPHRVTIELREPHVAIWSNGDAIWPHSGMR